MKIAILFETSVLEQEIKELLKDVPDGLIRNFKCLPSDIIFGNGVTTCVTGHPAQIIYTLRLSVSCKNRVSALRAKE